MNKSPATPNHQNSQVPAPHGVLLAVRMQRFEAWLRRQGYTVTVTPRGRWTVKAASS